MKWEVKSKLKFKNEKLKVEDVVNVLLKNRGLKTKEQKEEFFKPKKPQDITLKEVGIKKTEVNKAIKRLRQAKKLKERVIVYGDYDADGVCATAILWETLYGLGLKVMPHIPDRFSEGYGINAESVTKLKIKNKKLKLIITVDNGIVASNAVKIANKLGIDVIITDHHKKGRSVPKAHSIIHTIQTSGSAIAWVFSREIQKRFKVQGIKNKEGLDLIAIGTVADLIPLFGVNRSFVKYGLAELNSTPRPGLGSLFGEAKIKKGEISTYHVGFIIAPRINAMGRLEHAIDSLRLLCTLNKKRAAELAHYLGKTNKKRQKVVEEVVLHAQKSAKKKKWGGAIILAHHSYHEGVIGLAAARLVEQYYRPAIVMSKGRKISKASARSISGFNMINAIRKLDKLIDGGGGHPMAAGFSIKTKRIEKFIKSFDKLTKKLLTDDILEKKLTIDVEVGFDALSFKLTDEIKRYAPFGLGNRNPVFVTKDVEVVDVRAVGREASHLKMKVKANEKVLDAIGFGMGSRSVKLSKSDKIDVAYNLEENIWNGRKSLQLKLKDIKSK